MKKSSKFKIFCLFLFATLLFTFLSCSIFDSSPKNIRVIEGIIIFSIHEGYQYYDSISEPSIMLSMVTEKIYPCYNWSILSDIDIEDSIISINFKGIYVPNACEFAFGPATSSSFLDISNGEYGLLFSYQDTIDTYSLTITDSMIKVTNDVSELTELEFNLYWRYPPNSFVYLCGTTTETSWICSDFLDTLLSEISLIEFQFPDSGRIPYPCSSQGHYYDMPAKYFFYETDNDFDKAGEILQSYSQRVISQYSGVNINISLLNWKTKRFYSHTNYK